MTPESQRIAIAEACGWTVPDHCITKRRMAGMTERQCRGAAPDFGMDSAGVYHDSLPDYLNDLNAMHEAEKVLPIDRQYEYGEKLRVISGNVGPKGGHFTPNGFGCYALAHLSATQRAEAFLRTLNLWKEN